MAPMQITCRIAYPDQPVATAYRFVIGRPNLVTVGTGQLHTLCVERSDGLQLKAYGFDLIDVHESALMVVRCNVEGAAGKVGLIDWD